MSTSGGPRGDSTDAQSFFTTLECELIDRTRFRTPDEARWAVFEFIEDWYSPQRRQAIRYLSPIQYERQYEQALALEPTDGGQVHP